MVAIPEIVSDNDSDDRDNAAERLDAEDSVASDGGTPTWMEWAKVHKAWAFVTQGVSIVIFPETSRWWWCTC
jgi:hypothetical protein